MAVEPSIFAKHHPCPDMAKRANPRASTNQRPWFHTGLRMNSGRARPPPIIKRLRQTRHGKTGPRHENRTQKVETLPIGAFRQ